MRSGTALAVAVVLSTVGGSAQAEDWCGYAARAKSVIECGYSTAAECESVIGKGGMCFIDPDYAANVKHAAPATLTPPHPAKSS